MKTKLPLFLSVARWANILGIVLVAHAVLILIGQSLQSCVITTANHLSQFSIGFLILIGIVTCSFLAGILRSLQALHLGLFKLENMRFQLRYPPLLTAVLIEFVLALFIFEPGPIAITFAFFASGVGIAIAPDIYANYYGFGVQDNAVLFAQTQRRGRPTPKEHSLNRQWWGNDDPVGHTDDDLFDAQSIAECLARSIMEPNKRDVALLGEFGSGKSTVMRLAQQFIRRSTIGDISDRNIDKTNAIVIAVTLEGWGLKDGETAAEFVLSGIVRALAGRIDCLAIKDAPSQYRAALDKSGSTALAMLSTLLPHNEDPEAVLSRFESVLTTINSRLILFLEDFDRNGTDPKSDFQFHSLLDRIHRNCPHISFVLAVSVHSKIRIDYEKVTSFSEMLFPIERTNVHKFVKAFEADRRWSPDWMDLAAFGSRSTSINTYPWLHGMDSYLERRFGNRSPEDALAELLQTPRLLKFTLRRLDRAWEQLRGEINYRELLLFTCLRTAVPEIFSFVVSHYSELRSFAEPSTPQTDEQNKEESIRARLDANLQVCVEPLSPSKIKAALVLVGALFKGWIPNAQQIADTDSSQSHTKHIRYWRRLVSERVVGLRDQDLLHEVGVWNEKCENVGLLQSLMTSEEYALAFENLFSNWVPPHYELSTSKMRVLTSQYLVHVLEHHGPKACRDAGFDVLRSLLRARPAIPGHTEWLLAELTNAINYSLELACDLDYWFTSREFQSPSAEKEHSLAELSRRKMRELAAAKFNSISPDDFCKLFDASKAYTLSHLVNHYNDEHVIFPPADWSWMVPLLLSAADIQPEVMTPQLMGLVMNTEHRSERHPHTGHRVTRPQQLVKKEVLEGMFPRKSQQIHLMKLLAQKRNYENLDAELNTLMAMSADAAIVWLNEQEPPQGAPN